MQRSRCTLHKVLLCARALFPIQLVSAVQRVSHSKLVLHTQGCAYPIALASRPWNAEVHIFPIQQGKTAFQSQSARNVALFLFLTELPGTYYGAVRDVYLAMATRASSPPCATGHVTSDKQKNNWLALLSRLKKMAWVLCWWLDIANTRVATE